MEDLVMEFSEYDKNFLTYDPNGIVFNHHKLDPDIPKSPIHFSIRNIVRDPELRKRLAEIISPCVEMLKADVLVDLPQSITPLVSIISDMTGIPMISIRSELLKGKTIDDLGGKSPIDGKYPTKGHALIIDDVLSALAYTKFKAIEILLDAGLQIASSGVLVVVDREEGGSNSLLSKGYRCFSLYTLEKILLLRLDAGLLSREEFSQWKERQVQINRYVQSKK